MNESVKRVLIAIAFLGLIVAAVIIFVTSQTDSTSFNDANTETNTADTQQQIENTASEELLQEIEADIAALEEEYDFSADLDGELLLVPDFESELAE